MNSIPSVFDLDRDNSVTDRTVKAAHNSATVAVAVFARQTDRILLDSAEADREADLAAVHKEAAEEGNPVAGTAVVDTEAVHKEAADMAVVAATHMSPDHNMDRIVLARGNPVSADNLEAHSLLP